MTIPKKILIIDDDPDILDALTLNLEYSGYSIEAITKDGEIVDRKIGKNRPDLIILDVLLSGHDGRHLCKKLKSKDETKAIPIIMMSAHQNAEKSALDAGADEFIPKPFDIEDLLKKVRKYIK